jgi:flavin reductase (DIM6/NTAB) family NADH-FMN oxidoreductase RutF
VKPAILAFGIGRRRDGQKKDTLRNIEFSKDFVVNIVSEALAEAMNQASEEYPSNVDEFKEVGLTPKKAILVKAPIVAESPVNLECKLKQILEFGGVESVSEVVIGEVGFIHVRDELLTGNHIEISKLKAIGRLGEDYYCRMTDLFEMKKIYP